MRGRAQTTKLGQSRRAAADKRLVQARTALVRVRTGVLLFAENDKQRARFDDCLDEISVALDTADANILRTQRPAHREADPSLRFLIEGCRHVARRHGVDAQRVARYVVQQAPKLTPAEHAVIISAESHRSNAEQVREAEKRLMDRLRPHRAARQNGR